MIFDSCSRVYRVSLCDDFPWLVVLFCVFCSIEMFI